MSLNKSNFFKYASGGIAVMPTLLTPMSIMCATANNKAPDTAPKKVGKKPFDGTPSKASSNSSPLNPNPSDSKKGKEGFNDYNGDPTNADFKEKFIDEYQKSLHLTRPQAVQMFNRMSIQAALGKVNNPYFANMLNKENENELQAWMKDSNPQKNQTVAQWLAQGATDFKPTKKQLNQAKVSKASVNPTSQENNDDGSGSAAGMKVYTTIPSDEIIDGTLSKGEKWGTANYGGEDSSPHNKIVRANDSVSFPYKIVVNPTDGHVHKNLKIHVTGSLIAMNGKYANDATPGSQAQNKQGAQVAAFAQANNAKNGAVNPDGSSQQPDSGKPNSDGFTNYTFDQTYDLASSSNGITVPIIVNALSAQNKDFFKINLKTEVITTGSDGKDVSVSSTNTESPNIDISARPNISAFLNGSGANLNAEDLEGKGWNGKGGLTNVTVAVTPFSGRADLKGATVPAGKIAMSIDQKGSYFKDQRLQTDPLTGDQPIDKLHTPEKAEDPLDLLDYGGLMADNNNQALQNKYDSWNSHPQTKSYGKNYTRPSLLSQGVPFSWSQDEANAGLANSSVRDSGKFIVQASDDINSESGFHSFDVTFDKFKTGKYPTSTINGTTLPAGMQAFASGAMYLGMPTPKFDHKSDGVYVYDLNIRSLKAQDENGNYVKMDADRTLSQWKPHYQFLAGDSPNSYGYTNVIRYYDQNNKPINDSQFGTAKVARGQVFQAQAVSSKSGQQPYGNMSMVSWNPDVLNIVEAPDHSDTTAIKYNKLDDSGKPIMYDINKTTSLKSSPSGVKGVTWWVRPMDDKGQSIANGHMNYQYGVLKERDKGSYNFYGKDNTAIGTNKSRGADDLWYTNREKVVDYDDGHLSHSKYTWYDTMDEVPSDLKDKISAVAVKTNNVIGADTPLSTSWSGFSVWLQVRKNAPLGNKDGYGFNDGVNQGYQEFGKDRKTDGVVTVPEGTPGFAWEIKGSDWNKAPNGFTGAILNADGTVAKTQRPNNAFASLNGFTVIKGYSSIRQWISDPSNYYNPDQTVHYAAQAAITSEEGTGTPKAFTFKIDVPKGLVLQEDSVKWGNLNVKPSETTTESVDSYPTITTIGDANGAPGSISNKEADGGTYGYKQYVFKIEPNKVPEELQPKINKQLPLITYSAKFDPSVINDWNSESGAKNPKDNIMLKTLKTRVISQIDEDDASNYRDRIWDAEAILAKSYSLGITLNVTADDGGDVLGDKPEQSYTVDMYPWGDSEEKENGLYVFPFSNDKGKNGLGSDDQSGDSNGSSFNGSTNVKKLKYNSSKISMWYYDGNAQIAQGTDPNTIDTEADGWHPIASGADISANKNVKAVYWKFNDKTTKADKVIIDDSNNTFDGNGNPIKVDPMISISLDHRGNKPGDRYYNSATINSDNNYTPAVLSNTRLYKVVDYKIAGYVWYDKKNNNVYDNLQKDTNDKYQYVAKGEDIPIGQEFVRDSKGQKILATVDKNGKPLTDGSGTAIKDKWGNQYYLTKDVESNPYASIPVHLYNVNDGKYTQVTKDETGKDISNVYTDEKGHYEFDNLKSGTYQVGFGNGDEFDKSFTNVLPGEDDNNSKVDNQSPKMNKLNGHDDMLLKKDIVLKASDNTNTSQSMFNNLGILWKQAKPVIEKSHEIAQTNEDGSHQTQNGFTTPEDKQQKFKRGDIITYRLKVTNNGGPYSGRVYDDLSDVRYNNDTEGNPMSDYVEVIPGSTTITLPDRDTVNVASRPAIDEFGKKYTGEGQEAKHTNIVYDKDQKQYITDDTWNTSRYTGTDGRQYNRMTKLDTGRIPAQNPAQLKEVTSADGNKHDNESYNADAPSYKGLNPFKLNYGQSAIVTFQVRVTKIPKSLKLDNNAFTDGTDPDGKPVTPPPSKDRVPLIPDNGALDLVKHVYDGDYEPTGKDDPKKLDDSKVKVGQILKYVVYVDQTVPNGKADHVTIQDTIPEGMEYVKNTAESYNGETKVNVDEPDAKNGLSVDIGTLGANGKGKLIFKVKVLDTKRDQFLNVAKVKVPKITPPPDSKVYNFPEPKPLLQKYVSDSPTVPEVTEPHGNLHMKQLHVGDSFYYKVKAYNSDGGVWKNATIRDTLPPELQLIPNTTKLYKGNSDKNDYKQIGGTLSDHDVWYDKYVDSPTMTLPIGDIASTGDNSRFVIFKVKIVKAPNSLTGDGYTSQDNETPNADDTSQG